MACEVDEGREWYLDFCASKHICNSHESFSDLQLKSYKFVTTSKNIIRLNQIGAVIFPFENGLDLILSNIAYALEYDSNLISLG